MKRRHQFACFLAVALLAMSSTGTFAAKSMASPASQFKKQLDLVEREQKQFITRLNNASSDFQREKMMSADPLRKFYAELLRLVRTYPKEPAGLKAEELIISEPFVDPKLRARAMQIARDRYVNNPGIAKAVILSGYYDEEMAPGVGIFLRAMKSSSSKVVAGAATFALASRAEMERKFAEAEALYKEAIKIPPDVIEPGSRGRKLCDVAKENLYILQNLSPGKKAPETIGQDVFGKRIKLSDYRGKVVLLSFFGDW